MSRPSRPASILKDSQIIRPPIAVANGTAAIPEQPGLGVELDEAAVEKHRIEALRRMPDPPDALIAVRWPTGGCHYFAYRRQFWDDFSSGRLPIFTKGVRFQYIDNNGSREWKELHERARRSSVFSKERIL